MKSVISFLTDSIYVFLLFIIVIAAFFATYALSPVKFQDSILSKTNQPMGVLGESDSKVVKYSPIFEEHSYFEVSDMEIENDYYAGIKIGPVSEGEISKTIVEVKGDNQDARVKVSLKGAVDDTNGMDIGLIIGEEKVMLQEGELVREIYLPKESAKEISLYIRTVNKLHYPLNLDLTLSGVK